MKKMFIIGLLVMAIVISGCSAQKTSVQSNPTPSTRDLGIKKDVAISGFAFNPGTVTISKGTTVVWTNEDSVEHTVISDVGNIDSSPLLQGGMYAYTFSTPGTYNYHCSIHPSMKGTIIVV